MRSSRRLVVLLYETFEKSLSAREYGSKEQEALLRMRRFYRNVLKKKLHTNGLKKRSKRDKRSFSLCLKLKTILRKPLNSFNNKPKPLKFRHLNPRQLRSKHLETYNHPIKHPVNHTSRMNTSRYLNEETEATTQLSYLRI